MNDEDRGNLQAAAQDCSAIETTINSRGWREVIKPALENRMVALVNDFSAAKTYEEFVCIQQAINAIKGLMDFIEVKLVQGREACKELRKNP